MEHFTINNWKQQLQHAVSDKQAGIKIACLTEDPYFSMYITEIPAGKKVNAHYHKEGIETYQILSGQGIIHLSTHCDNTEIKNITSTAVNEGDFFKVEPFWVHQLENTGQTPLTLIFGCPKNHLETDRYMTGDISRTVCHE
jgi:mannose-6-phosphate isomerase-like protein (cupin superfamily)